MVSRSVLYPNLDFDLNDLGDLSHEYSEEWSINPTLCVSIGHSAEVQLLHGSTVTTVDMDRKKTGNFLQYNDVETVQCSSWDRLLWLGEGRGELNVGVEAA